MTGSWVSGGSKIVFRGLVRNINYTKPKTKENLIISKLERKKIKFYNWLPLLVVIFYFLFLLELFVSNLLRSKGAFL